VHGEQGLRRVVAQRSRKRDLFFGGKTRDRKIGSAEFLQQLTREAIDHGLPVRLCRLGDDSKCGPAEAVDAEKARTQRHALLLA